MAKPDRPRVSVNGCPACTLDHKNVMTWPLSNPSDGYESGFVCDVSGRTIAVKEGAMQLWPVPIALIDNNDPFVSSHMVKKLYGKCQCLVIDLPCSAEA